MEKNGKNGTFFYKECKRTQRTERSFEKNGCPTLIKTIPCREEAAAYILEPVEADSRRGLKTSWQGTPVDDSEEGTSFGAKQKTPSKNKGELNICVRV